MTNDPQLSQLEVYSQTDELVRRLSAWAAPESAWEPLNRCRALVRRLLTRVDALRIRLEAPLVVATFGGTGTGKSSLVNALLGQDCTKTGRQRPTTTRPVLLAHPDTQLDAFGVAWDGFQIERRDVPLLRDLVIIDCPDPDTSEIASAGSNLERLHQLLPHCDVLIYTSTQQKYRSARVGDELDLAATGCRLLFVQTHADVDEDIRDDWRRQLDRRYDIPDMFFVDSIRALREQQAGQRATGDLGRLQVLLTSGLAASQRVRIRRSNLVDLIRSVLQRSREQLAEDWPAVQQLRTVLEQQQTKLVTLFTERLRDELLLSRNLWERRLLTAVTQIWGFSPFSSVLRLYNGLGNVLASATLFRARSSAQMALVGVLQGARWLVTRREEQQADDRLVRLGTLGLDDSVLREAQFVISGYLKEADLDPALVEQNTLETLREAAARVEDQFLGDAGRRIDAIIEQLAKRNSGFVTRMSYELLFALFVGFVLYRVGRNFFYDSFWHDVDLLPIDFYVSAGLIFLLWSSLLVIAFTRRLKRGLRGNIEELAAQLARSRTSQGLFPKLDQTCREIAMQRERLDALAAVTDAIRSEIAASSLLGSPLTPSARV